MKSVDFTRKRQYCLIYEFFSKIETNSTVAAAMYSRSKQLMSVNIDDIGILRSKAVSAEQG